MAQAQMELLLLRRTRLARRSERQWLRPLPVELEFRAALAKRRQARARQAQQQLLLARAVAARLRRVREPLRQASVSKEVVSPAAG